jgi:hypothetical protein
VERFSTCWAETIVGGKNFACWEKRFVILVVVDVVSQKRRLG